MPDSLTDPAVQAAIKQAERMVRMEEGQNAIQKSLESIDSHLAVQNGRIGRTEERLAATQEALTSHLQQITDRQEFPRLISLESRVGSIEAKDKTQADTQSGEAVATKRFIVILAAGLAAFMGLADLVLRPVVGRLLGLE